MTKKATTLIFVMLLTLDAFLWNFILSSREPGTEYFFLNIGQGDSQLLRFNDGSPYGVKLLIDGGPPGNVLLELGKFLPATDHYIDLVLMTHPQLDHFGGFIDVLKNYRVGAFLGTGRAATIDAYRELMNEIRSQNIPYITLIAGDKIKYGKVTIDVLSPNSKDMMSPELNDTCLVTLVNDGQTRSLFTCDAGENIESELIAKYDVASDILKVGHHGSRFSSSDAFLRAVHPKIAVIEVGKNTYGHPTPAALSRLENSGAKIFRTDREGTLRIQNTGTALVVSKVR